ncbi:MAG: hypothetical protein WAM14_23750 [Candidatus Nitrosopolaris sp.]
MKPGQVTIPSFDRYEASAAAITIIFAIFCNLAMVKEIDMKDIRNYEPSSNSVLPYAKPDIHTITKEVVDVYADKYANDLLRETASRLAKIQYKTTESIPNLPFALERTYYSYSQ